MLALNLAIFQLVDVQSVELPLEITEKVDYDQACMENLIGLNHYLDQDKPNLLEKMNLIPSYSQNVSTCEWFGVECLRGKVIRVAWNGGHSGQEGDNQIRMGIMLQSDWFPRGVYEVIINYVNFGSLDTRRLPKYLTFATLSSCSICGTLNFTQLPSMMERLVVSRNSISGPVFLTQLPTKMKYLDVRFNNIQTIYVCNETLPKCLMSIMAYEGQKSKKLRIITADGSKLDSRVKIINQRK